MEMARAKHEVGANPAQKTLNNTLAKLKLFGQQTVAGGKHADEEEDPEYLKVCMKGLSILWQASTAIKCYATVVFASLRAPTIILDKRMESDIKEQPVRCMCVFMQTNVSVISREPRGM